MYFKVFAAGTSGVVGALLGWPTLDLPVTAQGEGLGWCTHPHGFEYRTLNVVLPRTDDVRRINYADNLARYYGAIGGRTISNPEDLCPVTEYQETVSEELCPII